MTMNRIKGRMKVTCKINCSLINYISKFSLLMKYISIAIEYKCAMVIYSKQFNSIYQRISKMKITDGEWCRTLYEGIHLFHGMNIIKIKDKDRWNEYIKMKDKDR